jgi:hypothetical protein
MELLNVTCTCILSFSCHIVFLNHVYVTDEADQIKENEVGGACGTRGRGEKGVQGFGGKAQRKETICKTEA